uniref:G-protein coupled receptors family 1 profile domain-containing protein n=1 Tax=Romanomermis culicivorax TaxID=13658 RepID=A0A915IFJ3_ROMCU
MSSTTTEENSICELNPNFCFISGIVYEILAIAGLLINSALIIIFIQRQYCKRDAALIPSLSLIFCDLCHLIIFAVHVGPELIKADQSPWNIQDSLTNCSVFYFWVVDLFHLAYICNVRYNATCRYVNFRLCFTRRKFVVYTVAIWILGFVVCLLPIFRSIFHWPIFSINISLAEDMNESSDDNGLEYLLHFLHAMLITYMLYCYSICIFYMKQASKKFTTTTNEDNPVRKILIRNQRRTFRASINYFLITVIFIILVITWLVYKIFGTSYVTFTLKKVAYLVNSTLPALMLFAMNSSVKNYLASFFQSKSDTVVNLTMVKNIQVR